VKAAVCYETGDPSVFRYEEVPDPDCGPGDVLIKVAAISIEGGDTLARARGALATGPHIVGYQAAGEIIQVGAEVSRRHHRYPRLACGVAPGAGAQRLAHTRCARHARGSGNPHRLCRGA
jgi:NADPH:quinone reductase-like Zn-dependent oxidoreductase